MNLRKGASTLSAWKRGARLTLSDVVNDSRIMDERMGWHDERRGVPVWLCKTVGGTTMRWSGVSPRFLAHEFRARTTYGEMENTTLIDWPITLEELEPYYDKAEAKMGVSGTHGLPHSAKTNNFKVLEAGARRVGYSQITSSRIAINSRPTTVARRVARSAVQRGLCDRRQVVDAVHRNSESQGDRSFRAARECNGGQNRTRRRWSNNRCHLQG